MFDLFGMMDKIGKLKEAVEDVKTKCDGLMVTASSSDGMVTVVTSANKHIRSVHIAPEALPSLTAPQLEAAVLAAVNDALKEAHRTYKAEFKQATEGLIPNIPGLDLSNFMG
jgi:DNA-binding YbaB/EbfC family protein